MFRFKIYIKEDRFGKKAFHAVLIAENNKVLSTTEPMKRMSGIFNNISAQLKGMKCTEGIPVYKQEKQLITPYYVAWADGTMTEAK